MWLLTLYKKTADQKADKHYLKILHVAAHESEIKGDDARRVLIDNEKSITYEKVKEILNWPNDVPLVMDVDIAPIDLADYDRLLRAREARTC